MPPNRIKRRRQGGKTQGKTSQGSGGKAGRDAGKELGRDGGKGKRNKRLEKSEKTGTLYWKYTRNNKAAW